MGRRQRDFAAEYRRRVALTERRSKERQQRRRGAAPEHPRIERLEAKGGKHPRRAQTRLTARPGGKFYTSDANRALTAWRGPWIAVSVTGKLRKIRADEPPPRRRRRGTPVTKEDLTAIRSKTQKFSTGSRRLKDQIALDIDAAQNGRYTFDQVQLAETLAPVQGYVWESVSAIGFAQGAPPQAGGPR